jgi:hypothetical protein
VQFVGPAATPNPTSAPTSGPTGAEPLVLGQGQVRGAAAAGRLLRAAVPRPEYDAAWRTVKLAPGKTAKVSARLPRVVDTAGWVSADFHNHSTLSGDNSTQTEGRLAALIAEGVEFAPATEHQRITSYKPYLKAMGRRAPDGHERRHGADRPAAPLTT